MTQTVPISADPGGRTLDPLDELRALYRLTDRLYRARSMRDVYDAALDAILGTLGCERASVLLFSELWSKVGDGVDQEGGISWG